MKVGLIDVDGHHYPNIALMKILAYHKAKGDAVEWYSPISLEHYDKVYMSKVFSFTPDYEYPIYADEIEMGGSGYCISLVNGKEVYDKTKDKQLPEEIEHQYPDYSLYPELTRDRAYGFMSRGCPRGCDFCHVKDKEGTRAYKVADLNEFWNGQKYIDLLDPNTLACKEWRDILQQLIDCKARINFTQGVDIRLMTEEKAEMLNRIRIEKLHFAWDKYQDKDMILPKFEQYATAVEKAKGKRPRDIAQVYCLTNFDTTMEQDLERIQILRDMGYLPYVMIYDKEHAPKPIKQMQRWVNNRFIFRSTKTFADYLRGDDDK